MMPMTREEYRVSDRTCWQVSWKICGLREGTVDPQLHWAQMTEGNGGGAAVRKMAKSIALSLERHAEELDNRALLPELKT